MPACTYLSDLDKTALETSKMAAKKMLHSSLAAVATGNQHSGEPRPLLPNLTLLNLHSYEDLMRHFRKPLILWGIHVVTRHFDLLT